MKYALFAASIALLSSACAARMPETHYYKLDAPVAKAPARSGPAISVAEFSVDTAYDDTRIVYRTSPYKLEYYEYHRWSAPPGAMVADFLSTAYANTGDFERVVRGFDDAVPLMLTGRVMAIEEVDITKERWQAHLVIDLELRDSTTDRVLWTKRVDEREPLDKRHPEGLAKATSEVLQRVANRTAPEVAAVAARQVAREEPIATADDR